jgi:hypothetical protein
VRRRKIQYQDTCIAVFHTEIGTHVVVLFDSLESPLYKVAGQEASDLIRSVERLDLDQLNYTRRLQRLVYERAVADGAIINPERSSTHVADA